MERGAARHHVREGLIGGGWPATVVLYAVFTGTGLGVVLPGAILPLLLSRWALSDQQAGLLFFVFFVGSATGALLSRGSLPASIARGCVAIALGGCALGVASHASAYAAMALYGLGLGLAMTSISLLESRRFPTERAARITRLNLLWAAGACVGPWFALRGAAAWGPRWMLFLVAGVFALAALITLFAVPHMEAEVVSASGWWRQARAVPAALLLMVPLATGIESAAGGWLTTYSRRAGEGLGTTIGSVTCLWAGLLLSRLLQSNRRVAASSGRLLLTTGPCLIAVALVLLISSGGGKLMLPGALLLGAGIGPMYPALLALVLRSGEGGNAVFVAAGTGASVLPMATGLVSGWSGSLRMGLSVPLAGAVVMVVCGAVVSRREGL